MSPTMKSLGIDKFSRDERLVLVQEIWNTIAAEPSPSLLTDSQRDELQRRVAEDDVRPDALVHLDEVREKLLARFNP